MLRTDFLIRKFQANDREQIRKISVETAFFGRPWNNFFNDCEVLADSLTLYYTDYEPESCFVAVVKDEVAGYIIGSKDISRMRRIMVLHLIPRLIIKFLEKSLILKKETRLYLFNAIIGFIRGEFLVGDFSKAYPATLHINIKTGFQHSGIGTALMGHFLNYLEQNKIKGVHLSTMSEEAKIFFSKFSFSVLFTKERSFLKYYFNRNFKLYIMGKRL